jgi:BetI-type transcriptional repressor, C-terminal
MPVPADDDRRTFTVLYTAYFALSLTDPALAIDPLVRNSTIVIDVVAAQLRAASDTPADLDPDLEAVSLLAMSAGLGQIVLAGQSSPEQAQAVIDTTWIARSSHPGQRYSVYRSLIHHAAEAVGHGNSRLGHPVGAAGRPAGSKHSMVDRGPIQLPLMPM